MREYLDAGVQLGWLINPQQQQVEIYRQGRDVEVVALQQSYPVKTSCLD
jgi:Uma2 family endonuclease